jgi:site-specific DNA-methyltransferase (adenine-specific)
MISVLHGDCRDLLPTMEADTFDAIVTDPPYHLNSIVKRFGSTTSETPGKVVERINARADGYARVARGFMGKQWDGGDVAFRPETWAEVFRVLKPGGYLVACGGTRTYHRMVCAIEDAGFIIHPMLVWAFGQGFPKATNLSKMFDRVAGAEREVVGQRDRYLDGKVRKNLGPANNWHGGATFSTNGVADITAPATPEAQQWDGWFYGGQALKPSLEPICVAQRRPEGRMVDNVRKYGTGAINIAACRVAAPDAPEEARISHGAGSRYVGVLNGGAVSEAEPRTTTASQAGRWPPNLLHDGSKELEAAFAAFGERPGAVSNGRKTGGDEYFSGKGPQPQTPGRADSGSASRFFQRCEFTPDELRMFYSPKAGGADRADSKHPTIKPVSLLRWLVRLITPPGGHILDPFAGSGTTAEAAMLEGFGCTLIEREAEHVADIQHRIKRWRGDDMPLFTAEGL